MFSTTLIPLVALSYLHRGAYFLVSSFMPSYQSAGLSRTKLLYQITTYLAEPKPHSLMHTLPSSSDPSSTLSAYSAQAHPHLSRTPAALSTSLAMPSRLET